MRGRARSAAPKVPDQPIGDLAPVETEQASQDGHDRREYELFRFARHSNLLYMQMVPPRQCVFRAAWCGPCRKADPAACSRSRISWSFAAVARSFSKPASRPAPLARSSVVNEVQSLLKIFPRFPLGFHVISPQKVRRMISHNQRNIMPLMPLTPQLSNSVLTT